MFKYEEILKTKYALFRIKEKEQLNTNRENNDIEKNNNVNNDNENNNGDIYNSNNSQNINDSIMNHPIIVKLIDIGVEPIYSRRIFQYYHPQNYGEALDYLLISKGIVQHNFVQDRNDINSDICYLCGEKKKNHLGYKQNDSNEDKNKYIIDKNNFIII